MSNHSGIVAEGHPKPGDQHGGFHAGDRVNASHRPAAHGFGFGEFGEEDRAVGVHVDIVPLRNGEKFS